MGGGTTNYLLRDIQQHGDTPVHPVLSIGKGEHLRVCHVHLDVLVPQHLVVILSRHGSSRETRRGREGEGELNVCTSELLDHRPRGPGGCPEERDIVPAEAIPKTKTICLVCFLTKNVFFQRRSFLEPSVSQLACLSIFCSSITTPGKGKGGGYARLGVEDAGMDSQSYDCFLGFGLGHGLWVESKGYPAVSEAMVERGC